MDKLDGWETTFESVGPMPLDLAADPELNRTDRRELRVNLDDFREMAQRAWRLD